MSFARGKRAFGFCDRTGARYPLADLVDEYQNGIKTGFRVGRDVADKDHPQNSVGRLRMLDPQSLRNPRPDVAMDNSRQLFGWGPVWNPAQYMVGSVGRVTITFVAAVAPTPTPTPSNPTNVTNIPFLVGRPGAAAGQVGSVLAIGNTGVSGVEGTGQVGTADVSGKAPVQVTTVASTGVVGTAVPSIGAAISSNAVATSAVGSVTISIV
jgi:hypothetical protein